MLETRPETALSHMLESQQEITLTHMLETQSEGGIPDSEAQNQGNDQGPTRRRILVPARFRQS